MTEHKDRKTKITDAMREAGAAAIEQWRDAADDYLMAEKVYEAMEVLAKAPFGITREEFAKRMASFSEDF